MSYFSPLSAEIETDPAIQTTTYTPVYVTATHHYALANDTDHDVEVKLTLFLYDDKGNRAPEIPLRIIVPAHQSDDYSYPQSKYVPNGYPTPTKVTWTARTQLQVLSGFSQPTKVNGGFTYLNIVAENFALNEHGELVEMSPDALQRKQIKITVEGE